jgi:hypothetical protein
MVVLAWICTSNAPDQLARAIENAERLRQQRLAVGIERQALTDPIEKANAERALELIEARARGGLR